MSFAAGLTHVSGDPMVKISSFIFGLAIGESLQIGLGRDFIVNDLLGSQLEAMRHVNGMLDPNHAAAPLSGGAVSPAVTKPRFFGGPLS